MAKRIRLIPWLDTSQLKKQLEQLWKNPQKIKVDIDDGSISSTDRNIQQMNKTVANSNSAFGKLKNSITNTFSSAKISMTGYVMVLNEIHKAGQNAKQTIQDIDKAITDLSIATNKSRESVSGLVKDYNNYAKSLKSTTTQITSAADDYLRAGKSMNEAQALIKDSIMLSKLGQLDSSVATEDLLATINGFEMSIEEVERALDAMVAIDMEAATSSGDIATALKYCASSADVAGLSFNKLAAMIGAVQDKTQQSAQTIGTFMNTLLSRYRDVKIGRFVDDDGESLSDVESVLGSLKIKLRDSKEEFRDFETVIDKVAQSWDSYSSVQQAAIAKAFSGTRQQNRFIALMEGYNKTLELTEVAANSAGTAVEKFNSVYMNSLEAKQNALQASFESMIINSDFDEIYSGILDATTALVDFINQTNALKGVLTGLAVSSGIKFFLAAKSGATEAYIALNKFSNALKIAKQTNVSTEDFDRLLLLSNNLSASQMKLLLSSKSLSTAQKELILTNSGLSSSEAKLQLHTWGMVSAETGLTAATTTLGTAFKGLIATFVANPIMLVTMAISGAVMAYQSYNQKIEETRQKNIEASEAAIEHAKSLQELYTEYNRLASIQDKTTTEEEDFKTAVEDITKALGNKAAALEGLTAGTKEYADALAKATKEELLSASVDATVGRKSAEEELQNAIWDQWKGSLITVDSNSKGNALSEEAQKAVDIVSDALKDFETINRTWNNLSWDGATHDDPEAIFEYYNALIIAREQLVLASQDDEELLNTEIYKDMNSAINIMSESLDSYIEKLYEEEKMLYMAQNNIPNTTDDYKAMEAAMVNVAGESVDLQNKFKELLSADFSSLAVDIESVDDAISDTATQVQAAFPLFNQLIASEESLDKFQSSVKSAYDAYSTLLSGSYSSSELLDSIQAINKAVSDMGGTLDWEFIDKWESFNPQSQMSSLELLGSAIEHISEQYAKSALLEAGFSEALANSIIQAQKATAEFDAMNSQFDNLQSSYQILTGILESYNETGYISLDNLQSLLTADENLIAMLQVENGQLVLNQEAYEELVAAQLLDFKAKLDDAAAAEINALAHNKAEEATDNNAQASENAVAKLDAETDAFKRNTEAASENAITKAIANAEEVGVSDREIQDILDKYDKIWEAANKNYSSDFSSFMGKSAKSAAKATQKEVDVMAELNAEMDKLQSAYKSLCDIRDTYNKYGKITVDQYQELTNMGFNFLANLVDENGQLKVNAEVFSELANAKLQEMQIQLARNAIDTITGLKTEAEATEYLTYANIHLRDAALSATEALLEQARVAAWTKGEAFGLAADQIVQGYEASKQLVGKVEFGFNPSEMEKVSESIKEDIKDEWLEAYNEQKKILDHMRAMGEINDTEYYERLMKLAEEYFGDNEKYRDNLWEVQEQYHDFYESIKETYNWIENLLDSLAKKTNALIDKVSKFVSWQKKNSMINRAVKASNNEIFQNQNAYQFYMKKANSVGLSNKYKDKIQNGALLIEEIANEELSAKIEKYTEWLDKANAVNDTINDLYDQQRDLIRQKLDNILDYYNDLDSYLSSVTSKVESLISLNNEMGKRSSLTELVEQFASLSDQLESAVDKTVVGTTITEGSLGDSKKVADAVNKARQELIDSINGEIINLNVDQSGTYTKLLNNIAKTQAQIQKYIDKGWDVKKSKQFDKLKAKLQDYYNLQNELDQYATSNTIANYNKVYTAYQKLQNKLDSGKTLTKSEQKKYDSYLQQIEDLRTKGKSTLDELYAQLANADGTAIKQSEAEKIQSEIDGIQSKLESTATYQNLLKNIQTVQDKIAKLDAKGYDNLTKTQKKNYDKYQAQLEAYYAKKESLDENATAANIAEYNKIYDAWRKLQDKLDAGKNLTVAQWKNYNTYTKQLEDWADDKAGILETLNDRLTEALDPSDKLEQIEKTYEETAKGIYDSYQEQIKGINGDVTATKQYQNLLAKAQKLEQKKDTKGLTKSEQATLDKYNAELEALRTGGMSTNISEYIKTWEAWYKLQQKLDKGQKLSDSQAKNYDTYKAKLEAWNKEKQDQISDLLSLMEDDLTELQKTYTENVAEAEAEVNDYYANLYSLAKQIAEYNINALKSQLAFLDSYLSYYKELVSLYDSFSGDKLNKILIDLGELDEGAVADQISTYAKLLDTLQEKYDATLSEMNEYSQLLDALDVNDFESSMELFDKALSDYRASGDTVMAEKLQSVLDLLNERAIDADNWGDYADEWANEWSEAFAEAKQDLINTATEIQEVNDALRELSFKNITDTIEKLEKASSILSSITNLIQDDWLFDDGELSEYGRAKVALLVSQLEDAQAKANEYLKLYEEIQKNKDSYASDTAYEDALNDALQNYYDSLGDAASFEKSIIELMKKSAEEEINALKDIINARKKALQAKKDYYDYDKTIKNAQKDIDSIKAQIVAIEALSDATDAATKAKLAQLKAELQEKEDALQQTKDEHTFNLQIDALDDFANALTDALNESTKSVKEILQDQKDIIDEAKGLYQTSKESVEDIIERLEKFYSGIGATIDGEDYDYTPKTNSVSSYSTVSSGMAIPVVSVGGNSNDQTAAASEAKDDYNKLASEFQKAFENGLLVKVNGSERFKVSDADMLNFMQGYQNFVTPMVDVVKNIPDSIKKDIQPVVINNHYDSLINVEGNVDEKVAKLLPKQLEQSYEYTSKKLYRDLKILK